MYVKFILLSAVFAFNLFAAVAADMITAREATNIAEHVAASATNAIRSVDGAARMLPEYLHYAEFDDVYAEDARAFYEKAGRFGGGCSSLRRGNLVGRNFDKEFNDAAEFVVRVSCSSSRHGSVGVSCIGTNLTERMVTSGAYADLFRVLPGVVVDGINDAGLVAEVNVIPRDPANDPAKGPGRDLHAFEVVRHVLDNFDNALDAAIYVAAHYYIPDGSVDSYHWMIADGADRFTYVVEDGVVIRTNDTMTNYRVRSYDPFGTGYERYALLDSFPRKGTVAELLAAARFTVAYAADWPRPDEFAGASDPQGEIPFYAADRLRAWADEHVSPLLDANRRPAARGNGCWQTVHSSIYDMTAKTLSVAVQEDFSKRYVFRVDETGERFRGVEAKISAEVARASGVEARIAEEIDAFKAFDIRVVDELPEEGEAGVVYLVKAEDYAATKTRDEYLWSQEAWRLIGSTRFDSSMIAKTKTTTPIPPDKTNLVSYVKEVEHGGVTMPENQDGAVVIGVGAVGAIDPADIAAIDKKTSLRSVSVAIGRNAQATGGVGIDRQSIAIGFNSKASGVNGIAIGSGAVHWYEDDETGPASVASGSQSVAVGYDAKAKADKSVQIGQGRNETPNSLKFLDTFVVKDGKVQAEVDSNAVERISRDMLEPVVFGEAVDRITVKSHAISTYAPTNGPADELEITPTGSRNYEMYFPNTSDVRDRLPISFDTDIEGEVTRLGPWWTNRVLRLPAKITMKEPLPKTLILEVEEYETGWDWSPVVVRAFETNGYVRVEGTNLHFTAAVRIGGALHEVKNPLYGVLNVTTNGVVGAAGALVGGGGETLAEFNVD